MWPKSLQQILNSGRYYVQKYFWWSTVFIGITWGVSYWSYWTSWLTFPSLLLFWYLLIRHLKREELTRLKFVSAVFFIKYFVVMLWLFSTYPLRGIGENTSPWLQLLLIGIACLYSAFGLALGSLLLSGCAYLAGSLKRTEVQWLLLSAGFVVSEILAALTFSLTNWGQGSFANTYFGFAYSGFVLANYSWTLPLATLGGVYTMSFVLAASTLFPVLFYKNTKTLFFKSTLVAFVLLVIGVNIYVRQDKKSNQEISLALVTTSFYSDEVVSEVGKLQKQQALEAAVSAALPLGSDFLLLPEDSRYLQNRYGNIDQKTRFSSWQWEKQNPSTVLIDSEAVRTESGTMFLRASIYDGGHQTTAYLDKRYLVPLGEYVPAFYVALFRIFGDENLFGALKDWLVYEPGPKTVLTTAERQNKSLPGILFCFEAVNPQGVTALKKRYNPPFIFLPISHGRFHQPLIFWHQADLFQKTQAVQSRLPIAVAANRAESLVYLPDGKTTKGEVVAEGDGWQLNIVKLKVFARD